MAKSFKITNLPEFEKALKVVLKENKSKQRQILVSISMEGLRQLQRSTPIDTSRAASSWTNTVDREATEWKQPKGKSHYVHPPFKDMRAITATSVINLSNNIEYIIPLENGHSKQRKNFVRDTVAALTAQLTASTRKESSRKVR